MTNSHYILIVILIILLFVQHKIIRFIENYVIKETYQFTPKFIIKIEKLSYIFMLGGTTINFGLSGFYSMLYSISNDTL